MSHHVLITGSTGMVGKGVLLECLDDSRIGSVTILNRSSLGMSHPKLKEVLLKDFTKIESVNDQIDPVDACFHCMGVTSVGLSEAEYTELTYDVTKAIADLMYEKNPGMVFIYVTGTGADSSEQGRVMWARVKGRTENYLLNKGFAKAYMFRPGIIIPEKGIRSRTRLYDAMYVLARPLFALLRRSRHITTTTKVGRAMINALSHDAGRPHLENVDINQLAQSPSNPS